MKIKEFLLKYLTLIKYTIGCSLSLLVKIILNAATAAMGFPVAVSYLVAQILVTVFSYFFHGKVTFGFEAKGPADHVRHFCGYFVSVSMFKVVDYLLVVLLSGFVLAQLETHMTLGYWSKQLVVTSLIVVCNGGIFAMRYYWYKFFFGGGVFGGGRLDYYTGKVLSVYTGHAVDPEIAGNAASGGVTTALLNCLLQNREIDGVLCYRTEIVDGKLTAVPMIAADRKQLMSAQGSLYFSFAPLSPAAVTLIQNFPGKLAMVALPCTVNLVRKLQTTDPAYAKIKLIVGLFCGHNSQPELIERALAKRGLPLGDLQSFRFRRGKWRGESVALTRDGREVKLPTSFFTLYQNLFILSKPSCLGCGDHYAENADVSCGDIWLGKYKASEFKHSILAARTTDGETVIQAALAANALALMPSTQKELYRANIRACVFHKALRAKAWAGRLVGLKITVPVTAAPLRLNELLAALMIVPLYKFSVGKHGKVLFRVPKTVLKIYLYCFKGLTNF